MLSKLKHFYRDTAVFSLGWQADCKLNGRPSKSWSVDLAPSEVKGRIDIEELLVQIA